jgi:hypothetical protein
VVALRVYAREGTAISLVQFYRCNGCNFGFGPIGVGPYVPERPQLFLYCRDCKQGQTLVRQGDEPLACVHCKSTNLDDVQKKCPVCGSKDFHWQSA